MFKIVGPTDRFDPLCLRRLTLGDIRHGQQLVELANVNQIWGKLAYDVGYFDALRKGVPVCQHTGIVVVRHGVPYVSEALATVGENLLVEKGGVYVVLELKHPERAEILRRGLEWRQKRYGALWGIKNALGIWLRLGLARYGIRIGFAESDSMVCSVTDAETYDHGGHPIWLDGTDDDAVAPWDFLTAEILQHFDVIGLLDMTKR